MNFNQPEPERRKGLSGWRAWLVLACIGACFPIGLYILGPWNYYYGGHFHLIPGWQGVGVFHSHTSGGDYSLFVYISPSIQQYRRSDIQGNAWLCTPKGVRIQLYWNGGLPNHPGKDLTGQPMRFYASSNQPSAQFTGNRHPYLDFTGTFGDRTLTLDDGGSIARAFNPDGSLHEEKQPSRYQGVETLRATLTEQPFLSKAPPCPNGTK